MPGSTTTPVTRKNIDKTCVTIANLKFDDPRFVEVMSFINRSSPGDFDDDLVRVKISLPGSGSIYMNSEGEVDRPEGKSKLGQGDLRKMIKILDRLREDWESRCEKKLGSRGCELPGDMLD
jgi:hypothetical protein